MTRRILVMSLGMGATLLALTAAKSPGHAPDRVWIHPDIDRLRPERIAILPAVSFVWIPEGRAYLEEAWFLGMSTIRRDWLPAILCRERMGATSRTGDSLLNVLGAQVRSRARVDSTSAPRLARLLGVKALLCLRIDRWERIGTLPTTRIYVDLTAALVDSTGRLLWRASTEERLESVYGVPKVPDSGRPPEPGSGLGYEQQRAVTEGLAQIVLRGGRPGEMGMTAEWATVPPDFQAVVARVLARWAGLFPAAPRRSAASVAR